MSDYYRVEKPNEKLVKKFEECEEIHTMLDTIFENDVIKRSLEEMAERIVMFVKAGRETGLFSEEEMKILSSEENWIVGYKSHLFEAWLRNAALLMYDLGDVRPKLKSIIEDCSEVDIVETIHIFRDRACATILQIIDHKTKI